MIKNNNMTILFLICLGEIVLNQSYGTINIDETFLKDKPSSLNWVISKDDTALTKISFGIFNLPCMLEPPLKICNTLL